MAPRELSGRRPVDRIVMNVRTRTIDGRQGVGCNVTQADTAAKVGK